MIFTRKCLKVGTKLLKWYLECWVRGWWGAQRASVGFITLSPETAGLKCYFVSGQCSEPLPSLCLGIQHQWGISAKPGCFTPCALVPILCKWVWMPCTSLCIHGGGGSEIKIYKCSRKYFWSKEVWACWSFFLRAWQLFSWGQSWAEGGGEGWTESKQPPLLQFQLSWETVRELIASYMHISTKKKLGTCISKGEYLAEVSGFVWIALLQFISMWSVFLGLTSCSFCHRDLTFNLGLL